MQQLTKLERDTANSWSAALDNTVDENVAVYFAKAIRNLSAMVAAGTECHAVCAAAAECAATMLAGARSIVFEVDTERDVAQIISKTNAAFLRNGQEFAIGTDGVLRRALLKPNEVQQDECSDDNPLCPSSAELPCESNEILVAKAIPREDTPKTVLALICDPEFAALADGILSAFSELLVTLSAGRRVALMHDASLEEIGRAKQEWERTVDLLPEVVCLVDQNDKIVRANKTLERWGLGDVRKVRGLAVHELFHTGCELSSCSLRDSVSVSLAAKTKDGYRAIAVTDRVLDKTLIVHTRLMADLPSGHERNSHPCAVVVVSDISALLEAQDELATLNRELEARVAMRTRELEASVQDLADEVARRREAEHELQISRDELSSLSQQLIQAQEEERRRLSRELHDSLGQSLGAIKYSLERIVAMDESGKQSLASQDLNTIVDRLGEAIRETRSIAVALRPPMLDELGTVSAIRTLCQGFGDTFSNIAFHIEIDVDNSDIPTRLATPIFRIVQEALNNVVKHSEASSVLVALRVQDMRLKLEVLDDGVGFDSNTANTGSFEMQGKVGRIGMRERAANSGGILEVSSEPGEGTKISASWLLNME